jgi:hypothetical protein
MKYLKKFHTVYRSVTIQPYVRNRNRHKATKAILADSLCNIIIKIKNSHFDFNFNTAWQFKLH